MSLWFDILIKAVVYTTLLLELYLLWLIVRKTPERMASFQFALLLLIQTEISLTVAMGILVDPYMIFPLCSAVINGPVRLLGSNCARIGFALSIFFGVGAFWNQIYCLIFRYTAIQQRFHDLNEKFNRWPIRLLFTALGYAIQIVCAYFAYFSMMTAEDARVYVRSQKMYVADDLQEAISNNDTIFFVLNPNIDALRKFIVVVLGGFALATVLSIGFSVIIFRTIQANASCFTEQTYKLHRQLTMLLIIQFTMPMFFLGVPVLFTIAEVAFELAIQEKWLVDAELLMLCLYSLLNAAVTLVFVAPYRNYTIQWLKSAVYWSTTMPAATSPVVALQHGGSLKTTRVNVTAVDG